MITDDPTDPAKPIGLDGQPLIGLIQKHERLPLEQRKARPKREMPGTIKYRGKQAPVDPLDKAAQNIIGKKAEEVRLDPAPPPTAIYDTQVMWGIVGRIDGGQWSHLLVGENLRATTFSSRRRAEGVMQWLAKTAETDKSGLEYRVVPILRAEQQI